MAIGLGVRAAITSLFRTYGPTAGAAGVGAGLGLGAGAGGAVSQIGLLPFNAANNMIGSAYFGYGMILGERYMYQRDWPRVQERLDNGESIGAIMHEYTGTFTAMVMDEAKIIFDTLHEGMAQMMADAINNQNSELDPTQEDIGAQDDGINLTREEIEAMSDAKLTVEYEQFAKIGYAAKYNFATRTLIREIWLIRFGEQEIIEENEKTADALRAKYFESESVFLQDLSTWTFQDFIDSGLNNDDQIILKLGLITGTRNRSSGSDAKLAELQSTFSNTVRPAWVANPNDSSQALVNIWHMIIWFHQLTYI